MKRSGVAVIFVTIIIAGCAVRMGGPSPIRRDAVAWRVPNNLDADTVGARIQAGGYEFALIATQRDSAFLARAAWRAGLQMTRPGRIGDTNYVFFGPKAIGDTTHSAPVTGGGYVRLHDALFEIEKNRRVDLIIARFDSVADIRAGVRTLIEYIAKDVSSNVPLLLGFEPTSPQMGDSVSVLVRALLADTRECSGSASAAAAPTIRLLYGPEARVHCERADVLSITGAPVGAQFTLQ
jgi:hypothetical protein